MESLHIARTIRVYVIYLRQHSLDRSRRNYIVDKQHVSNTSFFSQSIFLAFDFCRFYVIIRFFHPRHYGQWPPTSKDFYTRSYPLHYFLILILEKEPVFHFSMLSAKQGYHFYNVFGMTRSLTGDWTRDLPHSQSNNKHLYFIPKRKRSKSIREVYFVLLLLNFDSHFSFNLLTMYNLELRFMLRLPYSPPPR